MTSTKNDIEDQTFMARALGLAKRGIYTARPNPCVGCVIVGEGVPLAEGWHRARGEPHAEAMAIAALKGRPDGDLVMYVTLEPCSHHGRTPPCVEQIARLKPARVVVAMRDPNPVVNGKGIEILERAGITVEIGAGEDEARWLNRGHAKRMTSGKPWVILKSAATLDGKTALTAGLSKWITSPASRKDAQKTRAQSCAILTGIGTALQDNPKLTVRDVEVDTQPLKVLVDSKMKCNPGMEIFRAGKTIIATAQASPGAETFPEGVEIVCLPDGKGRVDLAALLDLLGERECNQLLVEAGARLNGAFLDRGLADEMHLYLAPAVFGAGRGMFDITPPESPSGALRFSLRETSVIEDDVKMIFLTENP